MLDGPEQTRLLLRCRAAPALNYAASLEAHSANVAMQAVSEMALHTAHRDWSSQHLECPPRVKQRRWDVNVGGPLVGPEPTSGSSSEMCHIGCGFRAAFCRRAMLRISVIFLHLWVGSLVVGFRGIWTCEPPRRGSGSRHACLREGSTDLHTQRTGRCGNHCPQNLMDPFAN
jgi:hypothetical protein